MSGVIDVWGDGCDVRLHMGSERLSFVQERMPPPCTAEKRRHHARSERHFYVLSCVTMIDLMARCLRVLELCQYVWQKVQGNCPSPEVFGMLNRFHNVDTGFASVRV